MYSSSKAGYLRVAAAESDTSPSAFQKLEDTMLKSSAGRRSKTLLVSEVLPPTGDPLSMLGDVIGRLHAAETLAVHRPLETGDGHARKLPHARPRSDVEGLAVITAELAVRDPLRRSYR